MLNTFIINIILATAARATRSWLLGMLQSGDRENKSSTFDLNTFLWCVNQASASEKIHRRAQVLLSQDPRVARAALVSPSTVLTSAEALLGSTTSGKYPKKVRK